VTHSEHRHERYAIVARLGEVERQIEEVRREWMRFLEGPSPDRLAELQRSVDATGRSVSRLADRLNRNRDDEAAKEPLSSDGPNPRDLVAAGRELDSLLDKAQTTWSGCRIGPDADSLREISETLHGAERAAGTLADALRELEDRARRFRPPESMPGSSADSTLQQLLEEIERIWTALRRSPTLAGTVRLQRALRTARDESLQLAELARSDSSLSDPEALRYMGGAAESVRFPPYRDRSTGTYNGHGFQVSAEAELSRCNRYDRPFGLVLLLVDENSPGSVRAVIGAIRGLFRASDLLGRISSSEVVLGLPESDGRATRRISARILRALDAAGHGASVRRLSYSVAPADGQDLEELLARARSRLRSHDADESKS
jgi:GGDEF domain-containing protein